MAFKECLARMRRALVESGAVAAIVPTADPHLNEYIRAEWVVREALSGFTGSAGTLLVSADAAALYTDSRYWEQAYRELSSEFEVLHQTGELPDGVVFADWFSAHSPRRGRVFVDPRMVSAFEFETWEREFDEAGLVLEPHEFDWNDIWADRPKPVWGPVARMKRPGETTSSRLARIRSAMKEAGSSRLLLSALDDIAWTFNLRGEDIPYNPVFEADAVVFEDRAVLYLDKDRISETDRSALALDGVSIEPPEALDRELARKDARGFLWFDPQAVSFALCRRIAQSAARHEEATPPSTMKAVKTSSEIEGFEEAMLRDGAALAEFYAELDRRLAGGERLFESDAVEMLHAWRAKDPEFLGESFATIAAFGPNAALPHYQPPEKGGAELVGNGMLLIDSGAHYTCGTTDITRMTPVGMPTEAMRRDAAAVTRGMLRLLNLVFPDWATGAHVDAAARMDLWREGADFGHGTGHGVGYVLNVHEGPVSISPRALRYRLRPGNVISDEPGIYRPGAWGVRVENLVVVERAEETPLGRFLRFRALTRLPVDVRLLPEPFGEMRDALNRFNAQASEAIRSRISAPAREWLDRAARTLG